jgi:hypothetical protein
MIQDHILEHQIGPKITIYSYPFGSGADFNVQRTLLRVLRGRSNGIAKVLCVQGVMFHDVSSVNVNGCIELATNVDTADPACGRPLPNTQPGEDNVPSGRLVQVS